MFKKKWYKMIECLYYSQAAPMMTDPPSASYLECWQLRNIALKN